MKKFALLTAPFLSMGAVALFADAHSEHLMADNAFAQQSTSGLIVQQNGQKVVTNGTGTVQVAQITPEVSPRVTHGADPFITAEFIYWKAYQDGLDFAVTGISPSTNNAGHGRVYKPDFDWEPGFKIGFGLKFQHDGWDLYGNWTWLNEFDNNGHAHASANSVVASAWCAPLVNTLVPSNPRGFFVQSAHANWKLKFNSFDLELGRNFYISRYLTLRPHFGFKFGWTDQHYNLRYNTISNLPGSEYHIHLQQDFKGVGIRTGLDTVWYFAKHWGVYGDFAFAALWSDFDAHRKDNYADALTAKYTNVHNHNSFFQLTEVLELGIGLRYDTTFFVGDYAFYLQAGWEEQIWFNHNQFYDIVDDMGGNLTMQGLSVKAGLMF